MKRIVSLIVTLLTIASVYSETLPVEEIVNIPASFTDIWGSTYDACPSSDEFCTYYDNVFGPVYHPTTDANGYLLEIYYTSHDLVQEIRFASDSQADRIGYLAFCYLAALQSITFPQGITSIDSYAFQGTRNISTVKVYVTAPADFPENQIIGQIKLRLNIPVTLIDGDGNEITELDIPDGTASVGANAFYNCSGLTSVTFPDGLTTIGANAFANCSGLSSVTLPATVTSIGSNAFPATTDIWVPKGMKDYFQDLLGPNNRVFEVGSQIRTYNDVIYALDPDNHTAEVVGVYDDEEEDYWLDEHISVGGVSYTVTAINGHAFKNCQYMTTIDIPATVTSVGVYAFSGCSSLTSVNIPDGVTSIGAYAFNDCSSLASAVIPEGVTAIGDYTFNGCSSLAAITIPEGVTAIGANAFYGCSSLTTVTIPSTVTTIGQSAFSECNSLTKVIAPDIAAWCKISFGYYNTNPLVLAHHLYSDENTEYTDIVIPDDVTRIGTYTFAGCSGLQSVTVPETVTSIGSYAFTGCSGLTSVTVNSNSVMSYYYMKNIFGKQVENYTLGGNVTAVGNYAFEFCSALKTVTLGPGITSIGNSAFRGCSALTSINIPEGVTSIGDYAFYGCAGLTAMTIPESVTTIRDYAFADCTGLTAVYNFNTTPQTIRDNVFSSYEPTLYVPDESAGAYQADDVWQQFFVIGVLKGDVNLDHDVDVADFMAVANYILNNPLEVFHEPLADVAGSATGGSDGAIDVADFMGIANIILHKESEQSHAPKKAPRAVTDIDALADVIYIEPLTAAPGSQQVLSVRMKNSRAVSGFEFTLQLPEGITATAADGIIMAELSDERTTMAQTDYFGISQQRDDRLKMLCASTRQNRASGHVYAFEGHDGEVVRVTIDIPADYKEGTYPVAILSARTAAPDAVRTLLPDAASVITVTTDIDIATGIDIATQPSSLTPDVWYTLDGRRLNAKPTQKGIYIVNGKRVIVK